MQVNPQKKGKAKRPLEEMRPDGVVLAYKNMCTCAARGAIGQADAKERERKRRGHTRKGHSSSSSSSSISSSSIVAKAERICGRLQQQPQGEGRRVGEEAYTRGHGRQTL